MIEKVVEVIAILFIIFIFITSVLPPLGNATGSNTFIFSIALILVGIGAVASLFRGR